MSHTPTHILSGAMYRLAEEIESPDGVANSAIAEAALRLDEQTVQIIGLTYQRDQLLGLVKEAVSKKLLAGAMLNDAKKAIEQVDGQP